MKVKGYATFDKLKTCIVGRTYSKEQFNEIKNQKVRDILFRILDETEEDYQNLCKVLNVAGVVSTFTLSLPAPSSNESPSESISFIALTPTLAI